MRQASKRVPDSAEKTVRDIRRATRRHHSAEEKIRIVLEGLRGEDSIAELCRKEGTDLASSADLTKRQLSERQGSWRWRLSEKWGRDGERELLRAKATRCSRDRLAFDYCAGNDKQILITGATNGIGLAAAEALAARGANLAIVGRSKTRTRIASARIRAAGAGRRATVATFIADLSSQASVRGLAAAVLARYPKLDVLVNNTGAVYGTRQLKKDGIEQTWAVNHLAPFLLSKLLLHRLKESAPARI